MVGQLIDDCSYEILRLAVLFSFSVRLVSCSSFDESVFIILVALDQFNQTILMEPDLVARGLLISEEVADLDALINVE